MRTLMAVLATILVFSLCYGSDATGLHVGDANGDCRVNLLDAIELLQNPAEACAAGDVNDDGRVSTADGIYLLYHFFNHIPLPQLKIYSSLKKDIALAG